MTACSCQNVKLSPKVTSFSLSLSMKKKNFCFLFYFLKSCPCLENDDNLWQALTCKLVFLLHLPAAFACCTFYIAYFLPSVCFVTQFGTLLVLFGLLTLHSVCLWFVMQYSWRLCLDSLLTFPISSFCEPRGIILLWFANREK